MKRAALLLVSAGCAAVAASSSCSGHGGGIHGHGDLTTGLYVISNYVSKSDACGGNQVPANINGSFTAITVSGGTITVLALTNGTIAAGIVHAEQTFPYSWAPSFDCLERDTYTVDGNTTAPDEVNVSYRQDWVYDSGSQCDQAYQLWSQGVGKTVTLPCTSIATLHLQRVGTIPTPVPTPVAVSGVLTTAFAMGAPLTLGAPESPSSALSFSANIDAVVASSSNQTWSCRAPDPMAGRPHYELSRTGALSTDPSMRFSVAPSLWVAGPLALSVSSAFVSVEVGDATTTTVVTGTSGTALLTSAPLVIDSTGTCSFSMGNIPLRGARVINTWGSAPNPAGGSLRIPLPRGPLASPSLRPR